DIAYGGTCALTVFKSMQTPKCLAQDINISQTLPIDLLRLQSLLTLNDCFTLNEKSQSDRKYEMTKVSTCNCVKRRWLIVLLLLIS
ncbi:hypothetical protein ABVT39_025964, partial [Epinephelus coioides]